MQNRKRKIQKESGREVKREGRGEGKKEGRGDKDIRNKERGNEKWKY